MRGKRPDERTRAKEANGTPVIWQGCTVYPCLCGMGPPRLTEQTKDECGCGHKWHLHKATPRE